MAVQPNLPKWSTPERRAKLIDLFARSGGFCVFGEKRCLIPEHHYLWTLTFTKIGSCVKIVINDKNSEE